MNSALLQAHLRYQVQRHGWLAATGLAVLVAAIALQMLWVDGLHARNAALHQELREQRQAQAQKPQASEDKAQRQAAFFATLPDATQAVEAIDVLNKMELPLYCEMAMCYWHVLEVHLF